jgi:hypothetical protein
MAQYGGGFNQFGGGQNAGVNPNDLSFSNNFQGGANGYSSGSALIGDEELFDTLNSPSPNQHGMSNQGQEYGGGMGEMNMNFPHGIPQMDQSHVNGYSNTPEGDPIQSPFVHSFGGHPQFRQMQNSGFGGSMQSPVSYSNSPMGQNDQDADGNYLGAKSRPRLQQTQAQAMQRKSSSNARSPLTNQTAAAMANLTVGSHESPASFGAQPIRTPSGHHEKSPSGNWLHTPNSMSSFPGSGFSSPLQQGITHPQINDVMRQAGTSMPAKLGQTGHPSTQELKRKRRRESHNQVERRRRDNINERIQDLSKLVPSHRLEDEKVRKLIQNGTPLSPTLTGMAPPGQATSGLAGPGARRATGAGNITTGLPIEDKDKGPNKGDILNGAVSWTRDLMWMLHLKLQQQEELINTIAELGGSFPLELTEDEKRMQTELMEALSKTETQPFAYSRSDGSGLRVPHHTDFRGAPLNGAPGAVVDLDSISPGDHSNSDLAGDAVNTDQFWLDPEDDLKEEDEFMDLEG